jgi:hypothetical protein
MYTLACYRKDACIARPRNPRRSGNTVTLTGHVRIWAEHDAAIDAAWMATGVYDVRQSMDVTG